MSVFLGAIKGEKKQFLVGFKSDPNNLTTVEAFNVAGAKYVFQSRISSIFGKVPASWLIVKKTK